MRTVFLTVLLLTSTVAAAATDNLERAMKDLRSLTTSFEAYSMDNDGFYMPLHGPRDGVVADLDAMLAEMFPRVETSHPDPWGHPYRFLVSDSRRAYAMVSLGPNGKLERAVEVFLARLRKDAISEQDLTQQHPSSNIVFASGMLLFAPAQVFAEMARMRAQHAPVITSTPGRESDRDLQILASAIEAYLLDHDGLPQGFRGKRIDAEALVPILMAPAGYQFAAIDPWKRPYGIAISPSGRRTAVFTRGEQDAITPEHEALIQRMLRNEVTDTATTYDVDMIITALVPKAP
jgi:hypothetical protein